MGRLLLKDLNDMESHDLRKKIIKDKFNKLEFFRIDFYKCVFLSKESNTYGVYIDNRDEYISINPNYFMFNYVGIDEERWDLVDYYADYIIGLVKEKTYLTFDINIPWYAITFDRGYVDSINNMVLEMIS